MGVQNLWLLLSPAAQKLPQSFLKGKRLAIDISIWVIHILHGYLGSGNFENIHLLGIFKRLIRLLSLEVKPVFVFDGKVPEIKKRTVNLRAQARKVNLKKLAEKIMVKQIEGKELKFMNLKNNEESDEESELAIEEKEEEPKDLLTIFEEEMEINLIKELLLQNNMNFEEYNNWDYVRKRDCIRKLKEKALEEKQEKLKAIEDKKLFSKAQMEDYLDWVQKKKEINEKKQQISKILTEETIKENLDKIGGFKDFLQGKVEIKKDFVVVKKAVDPEIERMRNLMSKVPKPIRKYKKEKAKECAEKLDRLIGEKWEEKTEVKLGREGKEIENWNINDISKRNFLADNTLINKFNIDDKAFEPIIKDININMEKEILNIDNDKIFNITGSIININYEENNSKDNKSNEDSSNNKNTHPKNNNNGNTNDTIIINSPLKLPLKSQMDFINKTNASYTNKININSDSQTEEFMIPITKPSTLVSTFDSLRKEYHNQEIKQMISGRNSRSSSKSRQTDPIFKINNQNIQQSPNKQFSQDEILQELEKMENFDSTHEDEEMTADFVRLSNLNSFSDSLNSKFEEIKTLLELFGVPWVESPFEAEAQCADLELNGLIDGIITEDSDVFLFGGRKVFRKVFSGDSLVEFFDQSKIERDLGLNREKLISLALFLGSDYTLGVKGVGIVNAMEIVNAFETIESLERFKIWAEKADVLLEDSETHYKNISLKELQYKQFHKNFKKNWEFPNEFPDNQVVEAYKNPIVEESKEIFKWGEPDIEGLKNFCLKEFG